MVVDATFIKLMDEVKQKKDLKIIFGATVKGTDGPKTDPNAIDWKDPVVRMFKYMQEAGYRVIDLMKRLDKDRSLSVDRGEFKMGLMVGIYILLDNEVKPSERGSFRSYSPYFPIKYVLWIFAKIALLRPFKQVATTCLRGALEKKIARQVALERHHGQKVVGLKLTGPTTEKKTT